ncbi:MAG: N-6 DNA methylase, partial [Lachnospiraceae bacterium]|nr:N-6 DNA methylase [Lachnospiraceae bacterium]
MTNSTVSSPLLTLAELCRALSISLETGRNWVRLGKILPEHTENGQPLFSAAAAAKLQADLADGTRGALKSRRNKRYVSGRSLPEGYVDAASPNLCTLRTLLTDCDAALFAPQMADCAAQLLKGHPLKEELLRDLRAAAQIRFPADAGSHFPSDAGNSVNTPEANSRPNDSFALPVWTYVPGEDTLGLLYLALRGLRERKKTGAYYTPEKIAHRLTEALFINNRRNISPSASDSCRGTVLDPCCGTGQFLLGLPAEIPLENIYGCDLDPLAIAITRINMALRDPACPRSLLHDHFTVRDFLHDGPAPGTFHCILGNPPWGYAFTPEEKLKLKKAFSVPRRTLESAALFTLQALSCLAPGGELAFVLPESLLSVAAHAPFRRHLRGTCAVRTADYLGEAFGGVQCPSVILHLQKQDVDKCTDLSASEEWSSVGIRICKEGSAFTIQTPQPLNADELFLPVPDEDSRLLQKLSCMPGTHTLQEGADFALGIVTGDNRHYVRDARDPKDAQDLKDAQDQKDTSSPWRPVLTGQDILPFLSRAPQRELFYAPDRFQQMASPEIYLAPEKLIYRFVCDHLVFAYDDRQTLTLNSANILIPRLEGYSILTILALLNGPVSRFWFTTRCRSLKVLRAHLESIPLPPVDTATA